MSALESITRDLLNAAQMEFVKTRRTMWFVVGLLSLIHVLTVYPYLNTSHEIITLQESMTANKNMLTRLEPEITRLRSAGSASTKQLHELLSGATQRMISQFRELAAMVRRAENGHMPECLAQAQQGCAPINAELKEALSIVKAHKPEARTYVNAYAVRNIVKRDYADVQQKWTMQVRPAYLEALRVTITEARNIAKGTESFAPDSARALRSAADELTKRSADIKAIEISHNNTVDAALGTAWWHTIEGKGRFADAIEMTIGREFQHVNDIASWPSELTGKTLAAQMKLRDILQRRQTEIERQFQDQRRQLATLSGAASVLPVDLASFIGLFPLLIGVILGFLMMRSANARSDAATSAAELFRAAPEDREAHAWLVHRALGSRGLGNPLLTTLIWTLSATLWITFAALNVWRSGIAPPLKPWASAALGILLIIAAATWDIRGIRRLTAEAKEASAH